MTACGRFPSLRHGAGAGTTRRFPLDTLVSPKAYSVLQDGPGRLFLSTSCGRRRLRRRSRGPAASMPHVCGRIRSSMRWDLPSFGGRAGSRRGAAFLGKDLLGHRFVVVFQESPVGSVAVQTARTSSNRAWCSVSTTRGAILRGRSERRSPLREASAASKGARLSATCGACQRL